MDRLILHVDMNSFYASVELLSRPELKDQPVVVGGDEQQRHGVVLAKNGAAKACGIRTGESLAQARRRSANLVVLPPHHDLYHNYSQRALAIYRRFTPVYESFGLDECWLDLTARLPEPCASDSAIWRETAKHLAEAIHQAISDELGLTVSVGCSWNKVFAKFGSDYRKPDATTIIDRGSYRKIVWNAPVSSLLFAGPKATARLADIGILTIGQLAGTGLETLEQQLGKQGRQLGLFARGEDTSRVVAPEDQDLPRQIGRSRTYANDLSSLEEARPHLDALSRQVWTDIKDSRLAAQTLQITIRDNDFNTSSRQRKQNTVFRNEEEVEQLARELLAEHWPEDPPLRLLGVTLTDLVEPDTVPGVQLSFGDMKENPRQAEVQRLLEDLQERYGGDIIHRGY